MNFDIRFGLSGTQFSSKDYIFNRKSKFWKLRPASSKSGLGQIPKNFKSLQKMFYLNPTISKHTSRLCPSQKAYTNMFYRFLMVGTITGEFWCFGSLDPPLRNWHRVPAPLVRLGENRAKFGVGGSMSGFAFSLIFTWIGSGEPYQTNLALRALGSKDRLRSGNFIFWTFDSVKIEQSLGLEVWWVGLHCPWFLHESARWNDIRDEFDALCRPRSVPTENFISEKGA